MPVAEYMQHVFYGDHRYHTPGFISAPGHWYNPSDYTFIGWVKTNSNFYVPNTLKLLTKEEFAQRILNMHRVNPITIDTGDPINQTVLSTDEEVIAHANEWYDNFVAENLALEQEQG